MHKMSSLKSLLVLPFLLVVSLSAAAEKPLVLFDDGHAQTAGNADWVITGAFSDFADVFKTLGCEVRASKHLTAEDIKGARILVLPEPNSPYTVEEENAIVQFVEQGGGLYAISDHMNSDRNGDGIDSVGVLNRFLPKLGLQIDQRFFSEAPTAGKINPTPLTEGVKSVGIWGGSTVKCLSKEGVAHITVSAKNGGGAFIATNVVGSKGGEVVAMADSSSYDDGTGDPHDKLYNGFSKPGFNHDILARNSAAWLLEKISDTPQERLSRLMDDVSAANEGLAKGSNNDLLMHLESCEGSIDRLVSENPDLAEEIRARASNDKAFSGIMKAVNSRGAFEKVHGN